MAIQSDETLVTKGDLKELYQDKILPYLGGNMMMATNVSDYYSTDEKIIGIWKDKPLYKKTFSGTFASSAGSIADIDISSIPIDEVVEMYGVTKSSNTPSYRPIGCVMAGSGSTYNNGSDIWLNVGTALRFRTNVDMNRPITITLKYTKTTDTANSTVTTPGCYDLNRPDLWPTNKEIFFGNGLYGYRVTGTVPSSGSVIVTANISPVPKKIVNHEVTIFGSDQAPLSSGMWGTNNWVSGVYLGGGDINFATSTLYTNKNYDVWVTYIK